MKFGKESGEIWKVCTVVGFKEETVKFSKGYTMTFGKGYSKIWTTEL
jgi:hypothetical protein